jgi:membrane protein implicated in regulation of membrane protease activity
MEVITMVALIALAWVACAIIAYATHTLGTLLLWSIPIPVVMVAIVITMPRLYLDRVNVFPLRMHRRSQAKEQPTAVGREGTAEDTSEDQERLDAAA